MGASRDQGLWAECQVCSGRSPYSGLAEWHDGRLFGLFACPHHRDYFPVWRPAFDTLLADDAADAARHIQCLAERMCRLSSATADRLEALVREEEAVAPLHPDRVEVTPAPRVTIDLHLVRWSPTFAQLEATFGPATVGTWAIWPAVIPMLHLPGEMTPGQLGPSSRTPGWSFTRAL